MMSKKERKEREKGKELNRQEMERSEYSSSLGSCVSRMYVLDLLVGEYAIGGEQKGEGGCGVDSRTGGSGLASCRPAKSDKPEAATGER